MRHDSPPGPPGACLPSSVLAQIGRGAHYIASAPTLGKSFRPNTRIHRSRFCVCCQQQCRCGCTKCSTPLGWAAPPTTASSDWQPTHPTNEGRCRRKRRPPSRLRRWHAPGTYRLRVLILQPPQFHKCHLRLWQAPGTYGMYLLILHPPRFDKCPAATYSGFEPLHRWAGSDEIPHSCTYVSTLLQKPPNPLTAQRQLPACGAPSTRWTPTRPSQLAPAGK